MDICITGITCREKQCCLDSRKENILSKKVGLVGLGIMGKGMAENLLQAGYDLTVYNRTRAKTESLAEKGAKVADTPAKCAEGNEVVITMLADPPAIYDAVCGTDGVMEGIASGAVLIDCSTVDPSTTKHVADLALSKNVRFIDSPVAGSKDAAASGELVMMVGGDDATLNEVRDILDAVSKRIIFAGPQGSGTMVKLCFNLCVSHMAAAISESMVLGTKFGLKPEIILSTIMSGTIASHFYDWKGKCIMDRDFATNFSTALMHKDTGLMMNAGRDLEVPLPVTAAVRELFSMAKGNGQAEDDFISVVNVLENLAGIEVKGQE